MYLQRDVMASGKRYVIITPQYFYIDHIKGSIHFVVFLKIIRRKMNYVHIDWENISVHKISLPPPLLLRCLYQARKSSGHILVCHGYWFCLFLRFFFWILKLFRQWGIYCFLFFFIIYWKRLVQRVLILKGNRYNTGRELYFWNSP